MSIQLARKEAERLAQRFGFTAPPIDVKRICRGLDLVLVEGDLGDGVSGLLITNPDSARVCVSEADHPNRKRFTIAHEIGHFYLRHQFQPGEHVHIERGHFISQRGPRASKGIDIKEIEANQFASSLLMPARMIEQEAKRMAGTGLLLDFHVAAMADTFKVSEQAMTIRLTTLGLL